ncbi:hypothetical protein MN116_008062 [Schistosoma mekongi]|uniref:Glycosyltransferase-like protein LARGE n=1 Tax=Schistosoma mekongi TaxID=38744 RepID=A0AAE1Z7W6_SCHME|nr:hypothetical protein MN116_008062 [Schistosoma mekongi]
MIKQFTQSNKQNKHRCHFNNKIISSIIIIMVSITWSIYYVITRITDEDVKMKSQVTTDNRIHIVILFDGDIGLQYLNSLLKSIFYHQNGRFRCDLNNCCQSHFCNRFIDNCHSYSNNMLNSSSIVFHFLISTISSNNGLLNLMNTWKLRNMEYHFYTCSKYLEDLKWISSRHSSGSKPFLKLMLTKILPSSISKVIVLDIDILLNADITELWNHFNNFGENQSIGIGLEQNPHFNTVMSKLISEWKGYGYNNGVMLFDLSKLRLTPWNELWMLRTKEALDRQGYLVTGEQDILNIMLFELKHILYELPCVWNVQLSSGANESQCPISWLSDIELTKRNYSTIYKQPKLLHINHHMKPNDVTLQNINTEFTDQSDVMLQSQKIYDKFVSVYRQYTSLNESCFQ